MKTIALRFAETFAPNEGTIKAHEKIIDKYGYVWYGKLGTPISQQVANEILQNDNCKILLINSGRFERYWAYIVEISKELPEQEKIPSYYWDKAKDVKTWFKVIKFEETPKNIMSMCRVFSSGNILSHVSKYSMSPYFVIEVDE